jgi:hypothetical protein
MDTPQELFERAIKEDATLRLLGFKVSRAEKVFETAFEAYEEKTDGKDEEEAVQAAAEELDRIKEEVRKRENTIKLRYFPQKENVDPQPSSANRRRRDGDYHDPQEEWKELKEIPSMPKLSESDSRSIYRTLQFKRDFEYCMVNTVPLEDKQKRYLILATPSKVKAKLNSLKRSEVTLSDMFDIIFKKLFSAQWKTKVENECLENVKQQSDEGIEDFSIRIRLFIDILQWDVDSSEILNMLRRKSRPEYEEIWLTMEAHHKWSEWIERAELFELRPTFKQLKKNFKKKHCTICNRDSHDTHEHVPNPTKSKEICRNFQKGKCSRGASCIYKHIKSDTTSTSTNPSAQSSGREDKQEVKEPAWKKKGFGSKEEWLKTIKCVKCKKNGHFPDKCPEKKSEIQGFCARSIEDDFEWPEFEDDSTLDMYKEAALTFMMQHELQGLLKNEDINDPVMFPCKLGGIKLRVTHDSGASYSTADKPIFERFNSEVQKLEKPKRLSLASEGGGEMLIEQFKLVTFETSDHAAVKIQIFNSMNNDSERVLISNKDAQLVGIHLPKLPITFPSKPKQHDREWIDEGKTKLDEQKASEEETQIVTDMIRKELEKNLNIPANSRCSLPNSEFKIDLKSDVPVYVQQYPYPKCYEDEVIRQHKEWLDDGRVEKYNTKHEGVNVYNSPLNPVPKKSGGIVEKGKARVTEDLRGQNSNTKDPTYILPRAAEMLQKLQGCKYFAEIDLKHAYHQIKLHEESQKVTGFIGPDTEQYVFTVMVEGLKGAAAHMQWVLDTILAPVAKDCSRYIDNVLVGGDTPAELGRRLIRVLRALNAATLRINPEKCKWCYTKIKFMGALITSETRSIDPHKVNVFQNMKRPKTGPQMESAMGFVNFVRDFIPLYSCIVGPLEKLRKLKKISNEDWKSKGAEAAWETLKKVLSNAPVLHTINWLYELWIATDASQYGVGCVLYQVTPEGEIRYIDFAAKALNGSQTNYPASKRELLALLFALKRWRNILLGKHFYVEVDNKALIYLQKSKDRMILDWTDLILEYDFTITFKRGVLNTLPHHLSHLYENVQIDLHQDPERDELTSNVCLLRVDQTNPEQAARRMHQFVREVLNKEEPSVEVRLQLVKDIHAENHVGADLMFRMLFKKGYYWRTMFNDCESEAGSCLECLRFNIGRGGFHPLSAPNALEPFDHIAFDFVVLNTSMNGYNFILLIVDVLTRFVILRAIKEKTAERVAWTMLCVFADFGVPKIMQSDSDRSFFNQIMSALRETAGFEQRRIMKYFPKANGLPERYVQEVKRLLEKWNRGDWSAWEYRLPAMQMSLNDRILSVHSSKPFPLLFARQFNGFSDFRNANGEFLSYEEIKDRNEKMIEVVFPSIAELEKQNRKEANEKENEKELKKRKVKRAARVFKDGDIVMKKVDVREGSQSQRWEGPFTIVETDANQKGHRLLNNMNRLVSGFIPAPNLRLVQHGAEKDLTGFHEIKDILSHRGVQGNREYLVKWKRKAPNEWVHELDCDAYDTIKRYWDKVVKNAKGEAAPMTQVEAEAEIERPTTPPLILEPLQPEQRRVTRISKRK